MNNLVAVLYIVAFAMFIYGLMGLTGPKTAVRGNWIAAAGMAVAVIATLIAIRHTENWPLIIAGLLVGVVLEVGQVQPGRPWVTYVQKRHADSAV